VNSCRYGSVSRAGWQRSGSARHSEGGYNDLVFDALVAGSLRDEPLRLADVLVTPQVAAATEGGPPVKSRFVAAGTAASTEVAGTRRSTCMHLAGTIVFPRNPQRLAAENPPVNFVTKYFVDNSRQHYGSRLKGARARWFEIRQSLNRFDDLPPQLFNDAINVTRYEIFYCFNRESDL
jgi:hypothetical protein